jgi:predicted nucleic acid-binding protein
MKIVIDTNIYISAIFWGGKPREVVDLGRSGEILIFTSPFELKRICRN